MYLLKGIILQKFSQKIYEHLNIRPLVSNYKSSVLVIKGIIGSPLS